MYAKSGFVNLRFCENKWYKYIQGKEREREREKGIESLYTFGLFNN